MSCIAADACGQVYPERWKLNDNDNKIDLIGGKQLDNNKKQVLEIGEHEFDRMMEAAQSCPVNAIHIFNDKGEKLI